MVDELELLVFEAMVAELALVFVGEMVAVLELVVSFWFSFRPCLCLWAWTEYFTGWLIVS